MRPMKKMLSMILVLVLLMATLTLSGCGANSAEKSSDSGDKAAPNDSKLKKMALVINGPVSDGGWNSNAWKGLEMAKEKYGTEIAVSENVKQSDYEAAFREYANQGYDLIIANGFEFSDAVKAVAADYPDTKFAVINGSFVADNVASLNFDNYVVAFLAGALAGYMTETNVVGFVGGQEIPPIMDGLAGLKAGLAYVNPNAKVVSTMADSWDDMVKGKEIAISQITSANADVLYSVASAVDTGVMDGAKEKGKYFIGQPNDKLDLAPGTVIASVILSTPHLVMLAADAVANGTFKGDYVYGDLNNGVHALGRMSDKVPKEIQDKMLQLVEDIKSGKVKIK